MLQHDVSPELERRLLSQDMLSWAEVATKTIKLSTIYMTCDYSLERSSLILFRLRRAESAFFGPVDFIE